jgi:hypothetical protein
VTGFCLTVRRGKRGLRWASSSSATAPAERDVQAAGLELLQRHPAVAWVRRQSVGAGFVINRRTFERLVAGGHLRESDARFISFGFPGAADHTGQLRGGRRLEVEYKAKGGRISDEQQVFHEAVNGAGGVHVFAYDVSDIIEALK